MKLLDSSALVMVQPIAADAFFSPRPQQPSVAEVCHEYAPRVYRLARRMMGHDADAEDVTQDVLLQVVRKLDTFRGEADLGTWLHRVTVNAALLYRRSHAGRRQRQDEAALDMLPEGAPAHSPRPGYAGPEQAVLDQERQEMIEQAIAGLPPMYRDVYRLSDVEQRSQNEIAGLLGLSLPAIKSRLHRARLMLREVLASYFAGGSRALP
jgi:RNA polymerase sigma-70 factor (ECF subfamily)